MEDKENKINLEKTVFEGYQSHSRMGLVSDANKSAVDIVSTMDRKSDYYLLNIMKALPLSFFSTDCDSASIHYMRRGMMPLIYRPKIVYGNMNMESFKSIILTSPTSITPVYITQIGDDSTYGLDEGKIMSRKIKHKFSATRGILFDKDMRLIMAVVYNDDIKEVSALRDWYIQNNIMQVNSGANAKFVSDMNITQISDIWKALKENPNKHMYDLTQRRLITYKINPNTSNSQEIYNIMNIPMSVYNIFDIIRNENLRFSKIIMNGKYMKPSEMRKSFVSPMMKTQIKKMITSGLKVQIEDDPELESQPLSSGAIDIDYIKNSEAIQKSLLSYFQSTEKALLSSKTLHSY